MIIKQAKELIGLTMLGEGIIGFLKPKKILAFDEK